MKKNPEIIQIINRLKKTYPKAKTALNFTSPLEILVATILSAQSTDKQINKVTLLLFKKYKTVKDYTEANLKEFEQDIKSTGFYHNKAKNIIGSAKLLLKHFNGAVPKTMDELVTLPGVARKTANIVLNNAYGIVVGIAVDTHVKRLSYRLGLTKNEDPVKIEQDLMALVPKADWGIFNSLLVEHGRNICDAKKPKCSECILSNICPKIGI
ncbi:MAG: endonuclease III [Elusimicrobia bacterium]|nr:endonuclease III [Elusimicrobiota bacterium]MBU2614676.1 endonuclease III [Elusimicrobiota bacterium]